MIIPTIPGNVATGITSACLMIAAMSLGCRWLLGSKKYPNYDHPSKPRRFLMAVYGIAMAGLSVYRFNSAVGGGFEVDTLGSLLSVVLACYHVTEAVDLLRSRLPAYVWRFIARAKKVALCGSRQKRPTLDDLNWEGWRIAGPNERWSGHDDLKARH